MATPQRKPRSCPCQVSNYIIWCRVLSPFSLCLSFSAHASLAPPPPPSPSFLSLISPSLVFSLSLLPPSPTLSLAKAYSYGKQGTANYDDSDEDGATGYSYYSTSYGDEGSPAISSSNEEEESEPEELEESLENCSVNDSIS